MSFEDIAQVVELKQWELNNLKPRPEKIRFEPSEAGYGPAECEDCGQEMPIERREWGFKLCVPCKQITEKMNRR